MTRNPSSTTLDDPAMQTGSVRDGETSPLADAGREAGESAGHLAERAADIGFQQADRGKEQAAHGISQVAESIRRVSMDMQGEQPAIANAAQTAADQAERVANYLQQTDARELIRTVEDVARRQPLIFLGGAFLLGVAASRLLKAAGSPSGQMSGYGGDRSGHRSTGIGGAAGPVETYRATGPGGRSHLDELPSEGI